MKRLGLTLVEMLISLVCVILLMLAVTQLFSNVGTRISNARSMIDLTNRMRSAANRLRTDLAGHTCELIPWQKPESGAGYFEYIEGPLHDAPGQNGLFFDPTSWAGQNFLGDTDDVLMFTTRCKDGNFTGLYTDASGNMHTVQSPVAEVVWFLHPTMLIDPSSGNTTATIQVSPPTFTLYRHTYLVMPTYQGNPTQITASSLNGSPLLLPAPSFYQNNDISVHYDLVSQQFVANTLGDTTKRECRYGHAFINTTVSYTVNGNSYTGPYTGFPHRVCPTYLVPFGGNLSNPPPGILSSNFGFGPNYSVDTTNPRYGEDVVLTNVVSFDVQAWDPTAPVYTTYTTPSVAVSPSDPGFPYPSLTTPISTTRVPDSLGAFVDLNWQNDGAGTAPWNPNLIMSPFSSRGNPKSQLVAAYPGTGTFGPLPSPVVIPAFPPSYFLNDWLFDNHVNATTGLPDYGFYGFTPATYDTWSTHYEHDGLDQDNDGIPDEFADNMMNLKYQNQYKNQPVPTETSPPYPAPLRGIKITIRCYEPDSRQFHQTSVVESFVPE